MNLYIMFGANWLFFDRDLCTYFGLRLSSSKLFTSQFKIVRETFWNAAMHHASNMRNKPRGTVFKSDRWYFSLIKRKDWNDNLIYYNWLQFAFVQEFKICVYLPGYLSLLNDTITEG